MSWHPLPLGMASALLADETLQAMFAPKAELAAMLQVEHALAQAQAGTGEIGAAALSAITAACHDPALDHGALAKGMRRDGVVVPELTRQMRALLGPDHAASFHRGATSQDIIDTALMLRLKQVCTVLGARLGSILEDLGDLASQHGGQTIMARTRFQNALPFTLADKVQTWALPLRDLANQTPSYFPLQLGGPIGMPASTFGANHQTSAQAMAEALGLSAPAQPWHTDRRALGNIAHWCQQLATALGKIGADVMIMVQNPIAELRLTGGVSSAMPHKNNPVAAEALVTLARYVTAQTALLQSASLHENERSGVAWSLEWLALPAAIIGTGAASLTAIELISNLRPAA
jgi:3-carboxy-cis,cis-muconate cycloisomerase